jgi:hypothetical protein
MSGPQLAKVIPRVIGEILTDCSEIKRFGRACHEDAGESGLPKMVCATEANASEGKLQFVPIAVSLKCQRYGRGRVNKSKEVESP